MAGTRARGGYRDKQSGGSEETKRREFPGREGDDGGFDPSTSILESRLKNSVVVKDYQGILPLEVKPYEIWINTEAGEGIGLEQYGPVKVLGKKQRVNVLAVKFDRRIPEKSVVLSHDARKNLRVKINDVVKLYGMSVKDVPRASKVAFYPVQEGEKGTEDEDIFEMYIKPFFDKRYIFITAGNVYRMKGDKSKEFKVMKVMAYEGEEEVVKEYGIVEKDSTFVDGEGYVEKKDVEKEMSLVGYDDIGGCRKQVAKIRELIELPLKQPELFTKIGMKPPRGILLHGPPGTGKTLIAKAIANETGAYLHIINGPEIMSKMSGESESNLRKAFEEAEKNAPAIIFMGEIDSIAPNRDKTQGEVEKRIVSQLLTLMDGIKSSANVIVLAATNRPNSIDPALRRFGRFDRELEISVPDILGRLEILGIHTKNMNLDPDVDLMEIAKDIHGFTGSDIASLCSEAALQQIREKLPYIDLDREALDPKIISSLRVNASNFRFAISNTDPSSLRETVIETPNVSWTDIGGLEGVKMELKETVQYPVNFPEKFLHFGQNPSKGVLLYGPPGCGKTLLAKAVATECNANFISVKGPELLNMYVGESESNVRQLFDKARGSAPCVLFFDEIDSIGRSRSASSNDGGVSNNVLNQLLAEMDGMNQKKNVFVIGATNRPDQLDSALMRPGRLDQLVYIPLPDARSRASILRAKLSKTPIESDVSITEIANRTTGFSAADLSEVCQRAAKLAIRESIEAEIKDPGNRDAVRSLSKRHFEEALSQARRSVSSDELERFEAFARSMKVDIKHQNDMQDDVLYD